MSEHETIEEWRPVFLPNYPTFSEVYRVSSFGRVQSLHRSPKILKICTSVPDGYPIVTLSRSGARRSIFVHRLVAQSFLAKPSIEVELIVDHRDGDIENNHISNLRWVSQRTNCANRTIHRSGKMPGAEYIPSMGKWRSRAKVNGAAQHLGYYSTEELASAAYQNFAATIERPKA